MDQLGLGARVRRKESLSVLKQEAKEDKPEFIGYGEDSRLPEDESSPPDTNELQQFKDELLDIDRKKREHLQMPKPKGGGLLRWSTVLVVILFVISAGFFFLGGYLYSYNSPPASANISASGTPPPIQEKPDWRIGTVIESPAPVQASGAPVPKSYMARREVIERNEALADKVYGDTDSRLNYAARQEAKRIVNSTTSNIKSKVRSFFGETVGRIFSPVADTVVKGTMGAAVDGSLPVTDSVKSAMDAASGSGGAPGAPGADGGAAAGAGGAGGTGANAAGGAMAPGSGAGAAAGTGAVGASGSPIGDLFALELQTFYDSTDAFLFVRELKEKGYSATYIVRANIGKNVVFKVRVGNFATYADANATRKLIGHPSRVVLATRLDDPMGY